MKTTKQKEVKLPRNWGKVKGDKFLSKRITKDNMYVLLCDGNICCVESTEEEATSISQELWNCGGKHQIKKCKVIVHL